MANQYINQVGYGLSSALPLLANRPIVAFRAPTTADTGYPLGQLWVYPKNAAGVAQNVAYILVSIIANVATWLLLESGGGAGVFASLTVTPGPVSLTGTTNINTAGAAVTTIGTGGTGAVNIGNATGNTNVTGDLSASTTLTAGTGLIVTSGNATISTGNLVLSAAAALVQLPGPIKIMSGAGAPANGLATEAGDLYIRTDPAGATSRIYVATAANTWTNVTCAG